MSTCKGTPKKNHNPGWKAVVQAKRRADAEARQAAYDCLPPSEKLARAGKKQRAKLEKRKAEEE